jgi:hypothetical protein
VNSLPEEQELMRLRQMRERGRKHPRHKRYPLQFNVDAITEMELRARWAQHWLQRDMSIAAIVDETGRPHWWVQDWITSGCPLFDFPKKKQLRRSI